MLFLQIILLYGGPKNVSDMFVTFLTDSFTLVSLFIDVDLTEITG